MEQQAQEQEDHVHDVQTQCEAVLHEVVHDVDEAKDHGDEPQDLGVLQLLSGGIQLVLLLRLVHQQSRVDGDGAVLVGVHGIVHQRHHQQDGTAHDEVHGMEHGGGDGCLIGHLTEGLAGHQIQRDGARQTGVPDHEAGVGGGDQQGIVHGGHAAHDLLGQQRADDQAEAPVQPAADGGHEGGDQNGLLLIVAQPCHGAQRLLAGLGGGHGGAEDQHQSHLHGERQQIPEAALLIAPLGDDVDGAHAGGAHGTDKHHEGQDNGKQECIRQPPVDDAHAAIGEFLEHNVTLLNYTHFFCGYRSGLPAGDSDITYNNSLLR